MLRKDAGRSIRLRDVDLDLEVKANGTGRRLQGYGSVFGVKDSYGEVVDPGAFLESLKLAKSKGRKIPILWQHRSGEPMGVWDVLEEDRKGLYLEGDLLGGIQRADEALILAKAGAVTGLSIGYWVLKERIDEETKLTHLEQVKLVETSLVTFPANDEARVDAVKFALAHRQMPAIKDFEAFLRREAGLSRTQAALVVTKGFAELHRRESGAGDEDPALKAALEELRSAAAAFDAPLF